MIPFLILGAVIGAGLVLGVAFWDEIKSWLGKIVNKIKTAIGRAVAGFKVFVQKVGERLKQLAKSYHQDENQRWHETTTTREIPESEVPPEILAKAKRSSQQVDITTEVQEQLELALH